MNWRQSLRRREARRTKYTCTESSKHCDTAPESIALNTNLILDQLTHIPLVVGCRKNVNAPNKLSVLFVGVNLTTSSVVVLATSVGSVERTRTIWSKIGSTAPRYLYYSNKITKLLKQIPISTTPPSSKYHTTIFKIPYNPLQSTTPPSSKYHTNLFKVPHNPLQSTTPPSSKYHTTLFNVPNNPLQIPIKTIYENAECTAFYICFAFYTKISQIC